MSLKWEVANYNISFQNLLRGKKVSKQGYLLRCKNSSDFFGYSDYASLNLEALTQASSYSKKHSTNNFLFTQADQSVSFALRDLSFSIKNQNVFKKSFTTNNHYLIADLNSFSFSQLDKIWEQGYRSLKIKVEGEVLGLIQFFNTLSSSTTHRFLLRLDFNAKFNFEFVCLFLDKLKNLLKNSTLQVEFLEDPLVYDKNQWNFLKEKYAYKLAIDLEWSNFLLKESHSYTSNCSEKKNHNNFLKTYAFSTIILKPAVQEVFSIVEYFKAQGVNFVLTHYMDHSLGRLHALWCLQQLVSLYGKDYFLDAGLNSFFIKNDKINWKSFSPLKPSTLKGVGNICSFKDIFDPNAIKWHSL